MNDLEILENYDKLAAHESSLSINGYLNYLVCDSRPPKRLKLLLEKEPWQAELYQLLTPLFACAGGFADTDRKAAFVTAPRGHSKTSTVAHLLNYALCFAKRKLSVTAAAADVDQARILLQRMQAEASHNTWLANLLTFRNYTVSGPTGTLDVISSDAPSSSGRLDDIIIIDEIVWWRKRDLFDILLSGRNKRPDSIIIVISNSGIIGTWQHSLYQTAKESPKWVSHAIPAYSASWLDQSAIEDDRKLLLPSIFKRLHLNQWCDANEENAFVTRGQIEACINYKQQFEGTNHKYIAAVDYAAVHDRTAACVMHSEGDDIYLDDMVCWQGSHENRMDITRLENWLEEKIKQFRVKKLIADNYQLEQFCQKFEKKMEVERFSFGGSHHYQLAENLRSLILNQRLHIYHNAGELQLPNGTKEDLTEEIANLIIEDKGQGRWRFNHTPENHDDRSIVLALASLALVRTNKPGVWITQPTTSAIDNFDSRLAKMKSEGERLLEVEKERVCTLDD